MIKGAKTMAPTGKKDQGVALFQTLLITAMLALIAIGFSQRTQDHVHQAQRLEDRTRAMLLAHSAVQDALFVLLTESEPPPEAKPCGESDGDNVAPERGFNRYGAPFCLEGGAKVIIQDLSGLLPVAYPDHPLWPRFLREVGLDETQIQEMLGTLHDFQDLDRRGYIAGTAEPEALPSGRPYANTLAQRPSLLEELIGREELRLTLTENSSFKSPVVFNPTFAPEPLLRAFYGADLAHTFLSLRREGRLDPTEIKAFATSLGDPETVLLAPIGSGRLRIKASASSGDVSSRRSMIVDLRLSSTPPLRILALGDS